MKLLASILTLLLFFGPVVLAVCGWPVEGDVFPNKKLYPAYYVLLVYAIYAFTKGKLGKKDIRTALTIIILVLFWYGANRVFGIRRSKMVLFNSMALPALYYIFYQTLRGESIKACVKKVLLSMFVINSLFAIYERLTMTLWFPFDLIRTDFSLDDITNDAEFRSSALLGHPLTNALSMAIIMIFILTSKMSALLKYLLYAIGMFGLFCFNSRASIMISGGTFLLLMLHTIFKRKASNGERMRAFALLLASIAGGLYLLYAGYGGRFEERGDMSSDNSVLARVQAWDIFLRGDLTDFLWGMSGDDIETIALNMMGIVHVENWFILSSLSVGLVITTLVTLLFIPLFKKPLQPYDRFTSFLILLVVVGLSSTNNSLACGVPALATFFACCYAFTENDKNIRNHKQIPNETANAVPTRMA